MNVLTFDCRGGVSGLYTEIIPLAELGALNIQRLTRIEFNNRTGNWEVALALEAEGDREVLFQDPSRRACLDWEHRRFNR